MKPCSSSLLFAQVLVGCGGGTSTAVDASAPDAGASPDVPTTDAGSSADSPAADQATEGDGDAQSADLSGDGRVVVFVSSPTKLVANDVNANNDVFAYERATRTLVQVSAGLLAGEFADGARVTADGRLVAFRTNGTAYLHGGTARQVILYDRAARTHELVSQTTAGGPAAGRARSRR